MEVIRGRTPLQLDSVRLGERLAGYADTLLDLGTGDGRFVRFMAEGYRDRFFIGVDACRENLRAVSRRELPNTLFVIAGAESLPAELEGLVSRITINFPWGSLLEALVNDDRLAAGLRAMTRPLAELDILVNADALATAGYAFDSGADRIEANLNAAGWKTGSRANLDSRQLRSIPTTWAKRLAFGRDPRAVQLRFQKA